MALDLNIYWIAMLSIFALAIIFSDTITRKYLLMRNKESRERVALKGATIHMPHNIEGEVMEIAPYDYDNGENKYTVAIKDRYGKIHKRIIKITDGINSNLRVYNPEDALVSLDDTVFVINVDANGKVLDQYLGIDFTSRGIDVKLAEMEARAIRAEKKLHSYLSAPLEDQAFMDRAHMIGTAQKAIGGMKAGETKEGMVTTPLVHVEQVTTPPDDEE